VSGVDVLSAMLVLPGAVLILLAAIGIVRFPNTLARMHASTKASTLGLILVLAGAALQVEFPSATAEVMLAVLFQLLTAPIIAHRVSRAAYRSGTYPHPAIDEMPPSTRPVGAGSLGSERSSSQQILVFVLLVGVWVALWGRLSFANVLSGAVAALAVVRLFPTVGPLPPIGRFRPGRALAFVRHFVVELFKANLVVAREVVTPANRINEAIVRVPIGATTDTMITFLANAVSLTPGTMTVEVEIDPPALDVHVLHFRGVEEVRADIGELAGYAIRAFGTDEDCARLTSGG
jgi:multicomponent Na+:H+ antiporter subunit G